MLQVCEAMQVLVQYKMSQINKAIMLQSQASACVDLAASAWWKGGRSMSGVWQSKAKSCMQVSESEVALEVPNTVDDEDQDFE